MATTGDTAESRMIYRLTATETNWTPDGDRTHRAPRPGEPEWRNGLANYCWGQLRSLYGREGAGGRWSKVAVLCTRCGTFWLDSHALPGWT